MAKATSNANSTAKRPAAPAPAAAAHASSAEPKASPDLVRRRAYEIYLERIARGNGDGDAIADWLQAERECAAKR